MSNFSWNETIQKLENEEKRKEMSLAAMERAKLFTVDNVVVQWYKLFSEVIGL